MSLHDDVKKVVGLEISRGNFEGDYRITEFSERPAFSAGIDTKTLSTIVMEYNPKYEDEYPGRTLEVMRDVARHEMNHRKYGGFNGCPRTLDYHVERILEPIGEVVKPKGFGPNDMHYMANAFEDSVLHADLNSKFKLDGISHFLEEVGEQAKTKKFTPFYEAHVKLNMLLWGAKHHRKQVRPYFTQDKKKREKINNAINEFMKKSGLVKLSKQVSTYTASGEQRDESGAVIARIERSDKVQSVRDRKAIRNFLNNADNWPELARAYAEAFYPLMEPSYAMPLPNHSGKGTKGQEDKKESQQKEGNVFDKQMETQEYKKKRIENAHSEGGNLPPWMNNEEALDLLYQGLARKLIIKVESFTEGLERPVHYYGNRPFDPDKDNLRHVSFGFNDQGSLELKKKRWHETTTIPHKVSPKSFPEARFGFLDTSVSMSYNTANEHDGSGKPINVGNTQIIPWGDNSKYHFVLLGWYGFIEYLKQNHLLTAMNISLGNFSDKTVIKDGLTEAKKLALNPNFGPSTEIELSAVKKVFEGTGKLVFTASDGDIHNWGDIKDEFIQGAKRHQYFHLQIGGKATATRDLEKANLHVSYVHGSHDLASKVIDLTDKLYRPK